MQNNSENFVSYPYFTQEGSCWKVGKNFKKPTPARPIRVLVNRLISGENNFEPSEITKIRANIGGLVAVAVSGYDKAMIPSSLYVWLSNNIDSGKNLTQWEEFIGKVYSELSPEDKNNLTAKLDKEKLTQLDSKELVSLMEQDHEKKWVCEAFKCSYVYRNQDKETFSYEFIYQGQKLELTARALSMPNALSEALIKNGAILEPDSMKDIQSYLLKLAKDKIKNSVTVLSSQCGWDGDKFIYPNATGEAFSEKQILNKAISERYSSAGDIKVEHKIMGEMANNKGFMGYLPFLGSPLVGILREVNQNPIINFNGKSGSGKSDVLLFICRGLFMNPSKDENPFYNWDGTETGRLTIAIENNNMPLIIDETRTIKDKKELGRELMVLNTGVERTRGNYKDGSTISAKPRSWKNMLVITSEYPSQMIIEDSSDRGGKYDGIVRRVLDIEANSDWFGDSTKQDTDRLKDLALDNYGNMGIWWVNYIYENKEALRQRFRELKAKRNLDLGFKEDALYIFELIANILCEQGIITKAQLQKQVGFIYENVNSDLAARQEVSNPHQKFLSILRDAIHSNPHEFGFAGSVGKTQFAKVHDGVAYFTKMGFKDFLYKYDLLSERKYIEEGLTKEGNFEAKRKRDFNIDGTNEDVYTRIHRTEIRFEESNRVHVTVGEVEASGEPISTDMLKSSIKNKDGEFIFYPNDIGGRTAMKKTLENILKGIE